MDDGRIIKVCIDECGDKQFASLLFDITGWIESQPRILCKLFTKPPK